MLLCSLVHIGDKMSLGRQFVASRGIVAGAQPQIVVSVDEP